MADDGNDNRDLTKYDPEQALPDVPTAETQDDMLLRNLFLYPTVKEAAEKAGFTGAMLQSGVYVKIKRKSFQNKIREYAIAHNVASLPRIMFIEDRVIDHLMKKPLDSVKHTRMLSEKKRIAGILGEDPVKPLPPTYNIQAFMAIHQTCMPDNPDKAIDAEVIEDE